MIHSMSGKMRRVARRMMRRHSTSQKVPNGERPADWYDGRYVASDGYHKHYTESVYYPSWTLITDRIQQLESQSVLDIGCGPGQFGAMLRDGGVAKYRGLDFCQEAINLARIACPEFSFKVADVFTDSHLEDHLYDTVVSLEFLEHVERDLDVLRRIKPGTNFIGSVPSFPSESHVRWFDTVEEVSERYSDLFTEFRVDRHLLSRSGRCLYIMQGRKTS